MQSYKQCVNFPGGTSGKQTNKEKKKLACQRRRLKRPKFDPWVRKMLWRGTREPPPFMHIGMCVLSHFSHVPLLVIPRTVAHLVPLSMKFSKHEYWSGLPLAGDLPDSGIQPTSLASLALAGGFFTILPPGKP